MAIRYKVKPRRDPGVTPCVAPLTALLACFATKGDLRTQADCAAAAKALHTCMETLKPGAGKPRRPPINYLLQKVK